MPRVKLTPRAKNLRAWGRGGFSENSVPIIALIVLSALFAIVLALW